MMETLARRWTPEIGNDPGDRAHPFAASHSARVLFVKDGALFTELVRGADDDKAFLTRILEVQALLGGEAPHAR